MRNIWTKLSLMFHLTSILEFRKKIMFDKNAGKIVHLIYLISSLFLYKEKNIWTITVW